MKFKFYIFAFTFLFLLSSAPCIFSQEKMTMEEYNAQLAEWQKRKADAEAGITSADQEVASLKEEIGTAEAEIDQAWNETLNCLGVTQADVDNYRGELKALENQIDGLMVLSPEELFKRRDEIQAIKAKLEELKKSNISYLTEMENLIATLEGKLLQLENKMPKAIYDEYTVVVGDYLWKISGKADIYNDPYQWIRIYSYNKDQIKDPDLIYAEQIFKIQREVGPNEYLVQKGDFLKKIAGNPAVLNDPAAWTKLYEANKDVIGEDKNLIYPYQVLVIPR